MNLLAILLLAGVVVVAYATFGLTISLVYYALSGLAIGAIARLVLPGREKIGIVGTVLIGLAGGALGGVAGRMLGAGNLLELVLSVVAAAILLTVMGFRAR